MGEYVKYKGKEVKIGTLESMYYVSYEKFAEALRKNQLGPCIGGADDPASYIKTGGGNRFRFPFPDEDHLAFGEIGKNAYDRSVPLTLREGLTGITIGLELTQQKPVLRQSDGKFILAAVFRKENGEIFRIEDDHTIGRLAKHILREYVVDEADRHKRNFYREIAKRINAGYHFSPSLRQAASHRESQLVGKAVLVHRELTADPIGKQGWRGTISTQSPEGWIGVTFPDGQFGKYDPDGLLISRPASTIQKSLLANFGQIDREDQITILKALKYMEAGAAGEALREANANDVTRSHCLTNCTLWLEKMQEQLNKKKGRGQQL